MLVRTSTLALLLVIGTGLHLGEADDIPPTTWGFVTAGTCSTNQLLLIIRICCNVGSFITVAGPVIIRLLIIA